MIIGIGTDLTDIRRIEKSLEQFGETFEQRIFTAAERSAAHNRSKETISLAATYAKRFAAKEACAKALGARGNGISWQEMEIVNSPSGQPSLILSGNALARLQALIPAGMQAKLHVSLSDEYPMAQAFVVISAQPPA